ncbi:hypothetical protein BDW67DRAFT_168628 [Aspergillus spinulosporus]
MIRININWAMAILGRTILSSLVFLQGYTAPPPRQQQLCKRDTVMSRLKSASWSELGAGSPLTKTYDLVITWSVSLKYSMEVFCSMAEERPLMGPEQPSQASWTSLQRSF